MQYSFSSIFDVVASKTKALKNSQNLPPSDVITLVIEQVREL